jgi:hypothetical protein
MLQDKEIQIELMRSDLQLLQGKLEADVILNEVNNGFN